MGDSVLRQSPKKLAAHVVKLAHQRRMTLATVEPCTAGSLAHLLAKAPGAGEMPHGGFVVYTKENKIAAFGVSEKLLSVHKLPKRWRRAA